MKVQFTTTFPDVMAFIWINLTRSWGKLVFIAAMSVFVAWTSCHETVMAHGRIIGVIAMLLTSGILFTAFCLLGLVAAFLSTLSRRNKTFMTDNTIELLEDSLITENRYGRSVYRWDIVQKITKTRRHIVLYVTQNSGIVVPRRALQTVQEWDAFCSFVVAHSNKGCTTNT